MNKLLFKLMSYDWVHNLHLAKDIQWKPSDFFMHKNGVMTDMLIYDSLLQPIKLSAHFFKINGFSCYQNNDETYSVFWRQEDNPDQTEKYDITIYPVTIKYNTDFGDIHNVEYDVRIRYKSSYMGIIRDVHEFQHALRVCELDELANTLKIE